MSPDGVNCYWSSLSTCGKNVEDAVNLAKATLKCTRALQTTPGNWCNDAAMFLGIPPSEWRAVEGAHVAAQCVPPVGVGQLAAARG
jgi:cellulase/cellobiase CelA1